MKTIRSQKSKNCSEKRCLRACLFSAGENMHMRFPAYGNTPGNGFGHESRSTAKSLTRTSRYTFAQVDVIQVFL